MQIARCEAEAVVAYCELVEYRTIWATYTNLFKALFNRVNFDGYCGIGIPKLGSPLPLFWRTLCGEPLSRRQFGALIRIDLLWQIPR